MRSHSESRHSTTWNVLFFPFALSKPLIASLSTCCVIVSLPALLSFCGLCIVRPAVSLFAIQWADLICKGWWVTIKCTHLKTETVSFILLNHHKRDGQTQHLQVLVDGVECSTAWSDLNSNPSRNRVQILNTAYDIWGIVEMFEKTFTVDSQGQ